MKKNKLLLRIASVCGVLSTIFLLIWLPEMITSVPGFSYTQNWISDLGGMGSPTITRPQVTTPLTMVLLTTMLAVVGTLNTVLALGVLHNARTMKRNGAGTMLYRYAAVSLLLASLSTILMGVFPETVLNEVPHLLFSFVEFLLLVAAALLMGVSYRKSGKTGLGNFSLALGVLMLLGVVPSISLRGLGELILWIEQMMWILLVSFLLLEESAS